MINEVSILCMEYDRDEVVLPDFQVFPYIKRSRKNLS